MGQTIVKLKDGERSYYLMWSSVCDAPLTYGMSLEEFREYYRHEHGAQGMRELPERLARVEAKGISSHDDPGPAEQFLAYNRAGARETCLSIEQILQYYCRDRPSEGEPERPRPEGRKWDEGDDS